MRLLIRNLSQEEVYEFEFGLILEMNGKIKMLMHTPQKTI